ncbi:GFA family protein [Vreelandella sp. EE22]
MTSVSEHRGACLCGSVSLVAQVKDEKVGACHCDTCRKWGGGPLLVAECGADVTFEGTEHIATFDSSEWAERGFCRKCGSHLFFRLKQGDFYGIPVGLFEGDSEWAFTEQVFIEQKPAFYAFSQNTHNLTGEELFAMHSGQQD